MIETGRKERVDEDSMLEKTPDAALLAGRGIVAGILMGLANLVPGISGGTMLLAAGVYPRFIRGVAELSTLKFRFKSILLVGSVVIASMLAVLLLAGRVKDLVVDHRWVMYSLFIGLTLGGIPVVWKLVRPATKTVWIGAAAGFVVMSALALMQQAGISSTGIGGHTVMMHGVAGIAGASAMILPGVSGGYLLLVLGQYIPILSAIDLFKVSLQARDLGGALEPALQVLLPVGIGVVVGVVAVSNLLRWLLAHYKKPTLGFLLGLLVGAVIGLWPFQATIEPIFGETMIKGQLVTEENIVEFDPEDYPTAYFRPTAGKAGGAIGLVFLGAAITLLVSRFGRDET